MEQITVMEDRDMPPTEEIATTNQAIDFSSTDAKVLRCPDCGHEAIALRCFVRRARGVFVGECIDLDIMVESPTPDGAVAALENAMTGYLEVVFAGPHPDLKGLILRPSPFSHRLRYHLECLKYAIANSLRERSTPEHSPSVERFYKRRAPSFSGDHCLSL